MIHSVDSDHSSGSDCDSPTADWAFGPSSDNCFSMEHADLVSISGTMWTDVPNPKERTYCNGRMSNSKSNSRFWRAFSLKRFTYNHDGRRVVKHGNHRRDLPKTANERLSNVQCEGVEYPTIIGSERNSTGFWALKTDETILKAWRIVLTNYTGSDNQGNSLLRDFGATYYRSGMFIADLLDTTANEILPESEFLKAS
jgi:hypothetical protein